MGMKKRKIFIFIVLVLMLVALPVSTVLANKQGWKTAISYKNETHEVVGSTARGTGNFGTNPDGSLHFVVVVRGLSGPPTGAHLHSPADTSQTAGVVVTLCGSGPGTAVLSGACPFDNGVMIIEGDIRGTNLNGLTGGQFFSNLNNELIYFNVHTELNPAGESRGQLVSR